MSGNNKTVSFEFATNEMRTNGANIRKWSNSDDLLLKSFATEVIAVAGGEHVSK